MPVSDSEGGDKWIFYHLPIKCRGNFVRLVLEECGIDYIDAYGLKNIDGIFQSPLHKNCGKPSIRTENSPNNDDVAHLIPAHKNILNLERKWLPYGCPFLVNYSNPSIALSQTPMIVQYISNRYGLRPAADIDHYRAGMMVANCMDLFDIIKLFEPKKSIRALVDFLNGKVEIFLSVISKPLENRLYYFDGRITQSDLALFNLLDALHELFGNNEKLLHQFIWAKYPNLKAHYFNILEKSKGIKKLLKRQKKCGVTWWPYYGPCDMFGIAKARQLLQYYAKSKL